VALVLHAIILGANRWAAAATDGTAISCLNWRNAHQCKQEYR
jgi:hypothetical protein